MYMGVILFMMDLSGMKSSAPHVYGGDPMFLFGLAVSLGCSPCIWG